MPLIGVYRPLTKVNRRGVRLRGDGERMWKGLRWSKGWAWQPVAFLKLSLSGPPSRFASRHPRARGPGRPRPKRPLPSRRIPPRRLPPKRARAAARAAAQAGQAARAGQAAGQAARAATQASQASQAAREEKGAAAAAKRGRVLTGAGPALCAISSGACFRKGAMPEVQFPRIRLLETVWKIAGRVWIACFWWRRWRKAAIRALVPSVLPTSGTPK